MTPVLCCLRRIPAACDAVRRGQWSSAEFRGREAAGRVMGIIGYGRLGRMVSRFAHAFGMRVLACDPHHTVTDSWVEQMDLDDLLRQSEIVSLHVHLTPETEGLIGRREIDGMRDSAILINTSRGKLIDEPALLDALVSGKLACAGLDVLANELDGRTDPDPLVDYARQRDNLVITPHVGGVTYDAQEKAFAQMARKVVAFFA
jgi:D-3-phosphoglycerate dehydrogenase / 2-oxoglutarate reductase